MGSEPQEMSPEFIADAVRRVAQRHPDWIHGDVATIALGLRNGSVAAGWKELAALMGSAATDSPLLRLQAQLPVDAMTFADTPPHYFDIVHSHSGNTTFLCGAEGIVGLRDSGEIVRLESRGADRFDQLTVSPDEVGPS